MPIKQRNKLVNQHNVIAGGGSVLIQHGNSQIVTLNIELVKKLISQPAEDPEHFTDNWKKLVFVQQLIFLFLKRLIVQRSHIDLILPVRIRLADVVSHAQIWYLLVN